MKWIGIAWAVFTRFWAILTARAVGREQDRSKRQAELKEEQARLREIEAEGKRQEQEAREGIERWKREHPGF